MISIQTYEKLKKKMRLGRDFQSTKKACFVKFLDVNFNNLSVKCI